MSLDFVDLADIARWKEQCADQRKIALTYPAYDPRMCSVEEFGWKLGPWSLRLVLEIFKRPYVWHASAACIEQIGYETVELEHPNRAARRRAAQVEVPQDALLARSSWVKEHVDQADFILNEMLGPLIRPDDKTQQVLIFDGLWARHLKVKFEGEETWRKAQN